MNQQFYKNMALWVVILVMILLLVTMLRQGETPVPEEHYTHFLQQVENERITKIVIQEGRIEATTKDDEVFNTYTPAVTQELIDTLVAHNVDIKAEPKPEASIWRQALWMWFPMLIIIGLWIFFIRQMQSGGGKAMSFGKSKARLLTENLNRVTFEDVQAADSLEKLLSRLDDEDGVVDIEAEDV